MHSGSADFLTGERIEVANYFSENFDIHHIFPRSWCERHAEPRIPYDRYNTIVNKSAISARTNRKIGGRAPSEYCALLDKDTNAAEVDLDGILEGHLIDPNCCARMISMASMPHGKPLSSTGLRQRWARPRCATALVGPRTTTRSKRFRPSRELSGLAGCRGHPPDADGTQLARGVGRPSAVGCAIHDPTWRLLLPRGLVRLGRHGGSGYSGLQSGNSTKRSRVEMPAPLLGSPGPPVSRPGRRFRASSAVL